MDIDRRTLLVGGASALLAGCTGDGGGADATSTATATPTGDDLDLRKANVTAVEFERDGEAVEFDATLFHDDDGEDGYANWWQVETPGGEQLGRRDLLHAHGTQRFTRSDSFEVPEDVTCVVVRGHDQTHEYGGQAMLVNLESGATAARRQGADRQPFDASDCP